MPQLHGSSVPLLQQIPKSIKTHELAKSETKETIPSKRVDIAQDNISKSTLTSTVLNLPKLKNQHVFTVKITRVVAHKINYEHHWT